MPLFKPTRGIRPSKTHPFARDLRAFWKFDEAGGGKVFDSSGCDNHGTLQADASFVPGPFGSATDFDGSDAFIDIGANSKLIFGTSDFTISFHVNYQYIGAVHRGIFCQGTTGAGAGQCSIYIEQTNKRLRFIRQDAVILDGTSSLDDGKYHELTAVREGDKLSLYVDGILENSNASYFSGINLNNTSRFVLAHRDSNRYFNGQFSHGGVWFRAFSVAEVRQLCYTPFCMFEQIMSPGALGFIEDVTVTPATLALTLTEQTPTFFSSSVFRETGLKPTRGSQLVKSHPLSRNLSLCYLFDDCSAGETANGGRVFDRSGNSNVGTIDNATDGISFVPGKHGSTLKFTDGNNDHVRIPDDRLPPFGLNDFTISCWCKHSQDSVYRAILTKGKQGTGDFWFGKTDDNTLIFYGQNGGILAEHPNIDSWPDDRWVHIAVTRRGALLSLYQDGVLVDTDIGAAYDLNIATDWRIGTSDEDDLSWAGEVSSLFVYQNRALAASEIRHHMSQSFCMFDRRDAVTVQIAGVGEIVTPDALALTLTQQTPSTVIGITVTPATLALTLTQQTVTIISSTVVILPGPLALTLTQQVPGITLSSTISPSSLSVGISLPASGLFYGIIITPTTLALVLTQQVPSMSISFVFESSVLELALTLQTPDILAGEAAFPDALALTLTQQTPKIIVDHIMTLYGAAGCTSVTPQFGFDGTIAVYVEDVFIKNLVSNVQDNIALSPGEKIEYRADDWHSVSRIDISGDLVTGSAADWVIPSALIYFFVQRTSISGDISGWLLPSGLEIISIYNTSLSGDISGWVLPSSLIDFGGANISISGDISGWVLPSGLTGLRLQHTSVSGDVSSWILPAGLQDFRLHYTSITGDVSGWTIPSAMLYFDIHETSVSGDISGWVLPSTLPYIRIGVTSLSGDISGWVMPPAMVHFFVDFTSVTGDISGWTLPAGMRTFRPHDTSLTGDVSGWIIPPVMWNFRIHNTSFSGDISGWVLPSTLIYFLVYNTSVTGDVSGWTLPAALVHFRLNDTSLSGDISGWVPPSGLGWCYLHNTSLSGDISGWTLPSGLKYLHIYNTSVAGDISNWTFPPIFVDLIVYTTQLDYDSTSGMFVNIPSSLSKVDLDNCLLTQDQVDNILADCVTSLVENVALDIGDNNSAPSAAGLSNRTTLIARGWAVKIGTGTVVDGDLLALSLTLLLEVTISGEVLGLVLSLEVPKVAGFYVEIPPFMQKDIIDPYSGGAWLWLCEIAVPGYSAKRLARNTEDVVYSDDTFSKCNIDFGEQMFSGNGTIPRVILRIFQDVDRIIEDIVNATEGALGAEVKLIKVNEKFLSSPVSALEANYRNLTTESDSEWVTFVLGVPNPLTQRIPLRTFSSSICPFATPTLFKGVDCQYVGADGTCTGTYEDCYQKGNAIHWGGALGLDPNVVRV